MPPGNTIILEDGTYSYDIPSHITPREGTEHDTWYQISYGDRPYTHPLPNILLKMMPIITSNKNLMPHYLLICVHNTLTIEYKPKAHSIPTYIISTKLRMTDNKQYKQTVGTKNNMYYGAANTTT